MSEKSVEKDFLKTTQITTVKRRGRPPGSKNKIKLPEAPKPELPQGVRRRGRPPGSKNKAKEPSALVAKDVVDSEPKTVTTTVWKGETKPPETIPQQIPEHPLHVAAVWLEKNMHNNELIHYKSKARNYGVAVTNAIIADMLGFFNVQNSDINKHVKRNNFIANI
jgi:hypothetical protein